jgi:hypothetical protein
LKNGIGHVRRPPAKGALGKEGIAYRR